MGGLVGTVTEVNLKRDKLRRLKSAYAGLIASPWNLGSISNLGAQFPLTLPANGRPALSANQSLTQGQVVVDIDPDRGFSHPNLLPGEIYDGEWGENQKTVDVLSNATGATITLYLNDGFGNRYIIATGLVGTFIDTEGGGTFGTEGGDIFGGEGQ